MGGKKDAKKKEEKVSYKNLNQHFKIMSIVVINFVIFV